MTEAVNKKKNKKQAKRTPVKKHAGKKHDIKNNKNIVVPKTKEKSTNASTKSPKEVKSKNPPNSAKEQIFKSKKKNNKQAKCTPVKKHTGKKHDIKSNKNIVVPKTKEKKTNASTTSPKEVKSKNPPNFAEEQIFKSDLVVGTLIPKNTLKVKSVDVNNKFIKVSFMRQNNETSLVGRIFFDQIEDNLIHSDDSDNILKTFPVDRIIEEPCVVIHIDPKRSKQNPPAVSISLRPTLISKIQKSIEIHELNKTNEVFALTVGTIIPSHGLTITKICKNKMYVSFQSAFNPNSNKQHKGRIDMKQYFDENENNDSRQFQVGQIVPYQGIILFCREKQQEYRISLRPSIIFAQKYAVPGKVPSDFSEVAVGDVLTGCVGGVGDVVVVNFLNDLYGTVPKTKGGLKALLDHTVCCEVTAIDEEKRKIYLKCLDV